MQSSLLEALNYTSILNSFFSMEISCNHGNSLFTARARQIAFHLNSPKSVDVCLLTVRIKVTVLQHLRAGGENVNELGGKVVEFRTRDHYIATFALRSTLE